MLNWKPKIGMAEGIEKVVDWYISYYKNCSPEDSYDY